MELAISIEIVNRFSRRPLDPGLTEFWANHMEIFRILTLYYKMKKYVEK
jgi:hypothetical protein